MSKEKNIPDSAAVSRDKIIVRTSIIGILTNVFLASFKAGIGLISNSIAVILDAVNNLSDALSSIITIVGTKLAGRLPDKKHPLGYGRMEYLTAMIVVCGDQLINIWKDAEDHVITAERYDATPHNTEMMKLYLQGKAQPFYLDKWNSGNYKSNLLKIRKLTGAVMI